MNDKHEISDELLTKYISGQSTEAEDAEVLDYMAQNDENVDDLMNIVAAIEAQKRADSLDAKKNPYRVTPWAVAASILLLVGIAWFFTARNSGLQIEHAPIYAEQDTIEESDTITIELPYNEE